MVTYVKGDATKPQGNGNRIIAHICNDSGGWGAGFVKAVDGISLRPQNKYREWYREIRKGGGYFISLGETQMVPLEERGLFVCNMIAQHGTVSKLNPQPLSYEALGFALEELADYAIFYAASVHMPKIGSGLARGNWDIIESMINRILTLKEIDVTVYEL